MICPVCKAANDLGPTCRRCRADLSLLFSLEERREGLLAEARQMFRRGSWSDALRLTDASEHLRRSEDARKLRALCHLMRREYSGAWRAYQGFGLPR